MSYYFIPAVMFLAALAVNVLVARGDEDRFRKQREEMVRTQIAARRWGEAEAVPSVTARRFRSLTSWRG